MNFIETSKGTLLIHFIIFIFRKIKSDRALKFECTDHNLQGYNDYLDFSTGYFVL